MITTLFRIYKHVTVDQSHRTIHWAILLERIQILISPLSGLRAETVYGHFTWTVGRLKSVNVLWESWTFWRIERIDNCNLKRFFQVAADSVFELDIQCFQYCWINWTKTNISQTFAHISIPYVITVLNPDSDWIETVNNYPR